MYFLKKGFQKNICCCFFFVENSTNLKPFLAPPPHLRRPVKQKLASRNLASCISACFGLSTPVLLCTTVDAVAWNVISQIKGD